MLKIKSKCCINKIRSHKNCIERLITPDFLLQTTKSSDIDNDDGNLQWTAVRVVVYIAKKKMLKLMK